MIHEPGAYSPMHTDENGCPREWDPDSPDAKKHSEWERNIGPNVPDVLAKTRQLTADAYRYVFGP